MQSKSIVKIVVRLALTILMGIIAGSIAARLSNRPTESFIVGVLVIAFLVEPMVLSILLTNQKH